MARMGLIVRVDLADAGQTHGSCSSCSPSTMGSINTPALASCAAKTEVGEETVIVTSVVLRDPISNRVLSSCGVMIVCTNSSEGGNEKVSEESNKPE